MALTIESGRVSARQAAAGSTTLYQQGVEKFGKIITAYLGHFPKALAYGHLLRVNPKLENAPEIPPDMRRGFMLARRPYALNADVDWERLDEPRIGAYIWGRDVNDASQTLYTANTSLFSSPDTDFWRTAYLKHALGDSPFQQLWDARDTSQPAVYDSLLYAVNNLRRRLPGWTIIKLKKTVFVDCEYAYQIALRTGSLTTEGFGIQPVLTENNFTEVFVV